MSAIKLSSSIITSSRVPYPDDQCFRIEDSASVARIQYKAQYRPSCFEGWRRASEPHQNRRYYDVLDNGVESNRTSLFPWIAVDIVPAARLFALPLRR
jgi:hypothetical protein